MKLCAAILASATASLVATQAFAQGAQGTWSGSSGTYSAPPYSPPYQQKKIDNIGADGQFIFGIERVTGIFFERQTLSYTDQATGEEFEHTFKGATLGLLGIGSASPSALPRFALDYVVISGLTLGGSIVLSTRGVSLDGTAGQRPGAPPTASPDGTTLLASVRAGYAFAFDDTFAVWPRAGLAYSTSSAEVTHVDPLEGESAGTFDYTARFGTLNLEILGALSPVEHIVLLGGPYLDLGLGGSYSVSDASGNEIDRRSANLTSFGLLVHAVGYY